MKRLLLIFTTIFLACGYMLAGTEVWADNLKYVVYDDGTAAWKARVYNEGQHDNQDTIKIADYINYNGKNYPVTSVIKNDSTLRYSGIAPLRMYNYVLGSNIKTIGDSVFYGYQFISFDFKNVEFIGERAFTYCHFLNTVDLNNVKTIGDLAFYHCYFISNSQYSANDSTLDPIYLRNVETIGKQAFAGVTFNRGTKVVTIPQSVNSIGSAAFYESKFLKVIVETSELSDSLFADKYHQNHDDQTAIEVVLPNTIKDIPKSCFQNRILASNPITSDFESLESIGSYAFCDCKFEFDSIVFPPSLKVINNSAYPGTTLVYAKFPSSLESIEAKAFRNSSLKTIDWGESNPTVASDAFNNTPWFNSASQGLLYAGKTAYKFIGTTPEEVIVRDGTTLIGGGCFSGQSQLVKVFLPESLEEIGSSAFSSCSNLTDVVLPANNNLKTIGSNAFYNCPKLENIVNFDNVEYLGISAFISGLDDITATTPAWYINQAPGLVYVGKVALRYRGDMPENTSITLKPNTTMIAEYCFFNQSNLVAIDCGDSLKYISESPFLSCTNLKKFTLNNGNLHLENIAKNAFNSCSFNELHITDLASWIYSYDTPSTTLDNVGKYDDQYPEIYYNANYDNLVFKAANVYVNGSKLEQLNVPEGVTTIHSNMVEGCSSLKSVHIPSTCSRITGNSGVFFNSPLETITIAEGNTAYRVRDNALYRKVDFYRDTMIVENPYYSPFVTIYKFTDWILEKGSKSTSVIQPVAKIVDYAFSRTRNPNLLTFEEGTKKIGKYAFSHCNFKKVVLPHSLIELGDYAFNWCNNLEEVVIGPQKPTFGHQPFVNCAKLSTIRLYIKDPSVFTGNASSSVFPAGCVIYVPRGSGESYRSTPYFTGYEIREFDDAPKGDVDGNGVVDGIDLNTMINFILGKSSPSVTQLEIADFDGDGAIDGTDLNQMINTILGQ